MPILSSASVAVAATAALVFSMSCKAEPRTGSDADAPASGSAQSLFSSWFAPRPAPGDAVETDDSAPPSPRSFAAIGVGHASQLVVGALGLLGISYRMGGNTPDSGFDCSGLVRYVFQNAVGLDLPRRAEEISRVGTRVDRQELKPGDLVFYKTLKKTFSHVGIYLGDNRFIHAPSAGGSVRVDDMGESYWARRFTGARRVER